MSDIKLYQGDCLQIMKEIQDESIDCIICDLPYGGGITSCAWDTEIPFEPLWENYERIIKPSGAIVLFGTQPFTTKLINSNIKLYRYSWVWNKNHSSNFQLAKLQPLKVTEDICVFSKGKSANGAKVTATYYPQKEIRDIPVRNGGGLKSCKLLNKNNMGKQYNVYYDKYPINILTYNRPSNSEKIHPTQKPLDLLKYLVKTYSKENQTILDNCMGSGSTGVACKLLNRNFIGIELDTKYFDIAKERIENTDVPNKLF